jgi:hypothetical protein
MTDQEREIQHWKHVAASLASMHAATLEGLPKSASKSNRSRHVEICKKAALWLRGYGGPDARHQTTDDRIEREIQRCENAAINYAQP